MDISVRELKNHLSEYLRRVHAGEELVVTSRGKEVARLVPPQGVRIEATLEEQAIARFRGLPWVRPVDYDSVHLAAVESAFGIFRGHAPFFLRCLILS